MATRKSPSPAPEAQSPSPAIRTALAGMEEVSAMIIVVRQSLGDEAAEAWLTLTVADRLLTETHDALERAGWSAEPSERQAVGAAAEGAVMTARKSRAKPRKAQSRNRSPLPAVAAPQPDDPSTWPVIWRVVAPCAGGYDQIGRAHV